MDGFGYGSATGVPFQQHAPPMFLPGRQEGFGPSADRSQHARGRPRARGGRRSRFEGLIGSAARTDARNRDRMVDNMVSNPAFWATVFNTLQKHSNVAEEIRRDVEEQERRAARASTAKRRRGDGDVTRESEDGPEGVEDAAGGVASDDGGEGRSADDLPDLYGYLAEDFENVRRTVGVQRLDLLLEELDVESLWSERDVMISFGQLSRILLRLFAGPYATDEENLIVRMLNLAVERSSKDIGFEEYRAKESSRGVLVEPFVVTYRRRGRVLRDFAAFRYVLEITEYMGRIGRKQKNDLILLYLTLTTPEVRLHRRWNAEDRENVLAFRDQVTGYAITTPIIMARPMTVEMQLDSVFGNASANSRLLERSLSVALNNRNRKPNGMNPAQEVQTLMENAQLLDLSSGDTGAMRSALRPFAIEHERAALRHMLEMSTVASMMAEEFRVFVAGAPSSGSSVGGAATSSRLASSHKKTHAHRPHVFRRPIFFTFKPTARVVTKK